MPTACDSTVNSHLADQAAFTAWKGTTMTTLDSFSNKTTAPTTDDSSNLLTIEQDVYKTLACLEEKLVDIRTTTNTIQDSQTSVLNLEQQIKDAEEQIKIAKDRVEYTRDPDTHTSFYESWFPMDRPMKPISIPIFIGLITFFGVIIVLLLLSYVGVNVSATAPYSTPSYGTPSLVSSLLAQFTPLTVIAIASIVGLIIYFRRRN